MLTGRPRAIPHTNRVFALPHKSMFFFFLGLCIQKNPYWSCSTPYSKLQSIHSSFEHSPPPLNHSHPQPVHGLCQSGSFSSLSYTDFLNATREKANMAKD